MSLTPGQMISGYRVVGPLGAGGMGEVYRARDTRLDRDVAIKVLPAGWDDDRDHVRRFEREAKTLASLNHANVAHVYGFDELDGRRFLVLELVEGEELAACIARGPLSVDETRRLCCQIAEGLEAAHELGVVHRDLKPANVRITPEGVAKVLDFGLAKTLRPGLSPESQPDAPGGSFETEVGVLVGTPTYMSPERIRGRPDDRRGDIWAFGCVLYECLTGVPPFTGATLPDTLATIVERAPDLSRLPRGTPEAIRKLVARCLDKDPRTRLRDIGEARVALGRPEDAVEPIVSAAPETRRKKWLEAGAGVLVFAAGLATLVALREVAPAGAPSNPFDGAIFTKVTDSEWTEFSATISRDGKHVAFASDRAGQFDVWVHQVGTWDDVNLTKGARTWWGIKVRDIGFNPDATRIWVTESDGARQMSLRGDDPKRLFREKVVNTDWSPDGRRAVYHTSVPGDPVFVSDADGVGPVEVGTHAPGLHQHFPMWSIDGEWIYLVRGRPTTLEMDLWRVRPEKGATFERMTTGMVDVTFPTPIDEDTVLFLANDSKGAGPWMWALDVPSRTTRRVLWGTEQYTSLDASGDGSRLVATVANRRAGLWRMPIKDQGEATEDDVEPVRGLDDVPARSPRFGGDDIYFVSPRGSGDGLWRLRDGRPGEILPGDQAALLAPPAVSPDGRSLAVVVREAGRVRLRRVGADGGAPETLSDTVQVYGAAAWSPDGKWIVVGGVDTDTGEPALFKFPSAGGPPERLVDGFAINPVWSPTRDLIVYSGASTMAYLPLRGVRPSDKGTVPLPEVAVTRMGERCRFLPDGRRLVYMAGRGTIQDFYLLDLDTQEEPRLLARFEETAEMRTFDIDPTGSFIVFDRVRDNSDVVLIELKNRSR